MALIHALVHDAEAMARLRRDLHAHPELGFEEHRTSDLVASQLAGWGIEVHRGMARTGVIGVVHGRDGGAGGRAIGLRADMDALPVREENTFAHASTTPGTMHACGHDGHTAMLLAAAQHLARTRDFDGTVVLIFQPAEEGRGGAQAMVAEGLFERFPVEAVFGLHNWPGYPVGSLAVSAGPVMAAANTFSVTVRGRGGHAAAPHLAIDPVPVACQMVAAFQAIVARNVRPIDTAVVSVTMIHTGEATNVVPDSCRLEGTVRVFRPEVLDLVERRMREIAEHTCVAHGAGCEFEFQRRAPPVVNHEREAAFAAQVIAGIVGSEGARVQEPSMASEDFAFMLQAKAGCYAFIGNGDGAHRHAGHGMGPCMLHNPSYDFNDALLPLGATYWVRLAEAWLAEPRP
ncbi:M20 aminoacylase family protein [Ideonella sp. A 288]|uniref:M20 aminoacylase family protein n=1 Tax=Ideonella sp. A 288 TaxID=1962181 RepID=UPI000B4BB969|nr:M20 aminoacylase family protein [Ideonella sp. A 288]